MSSIERAEALLRLLDLDDAFRASRPNGYAYARVVDVEHAADMPPDTLVLAIDPLARFEGAYPESPYPRDGTTTHTASDLTASPASVPLLWPCSATTRERTFDTGPTRQLCQAFGLGVSYWLCK